MLLIRFLRDVLPRKTVPFGAILRIVFLATGALGDRHSWPSAAPALVAPFGRHEMEMPLI